MATLALSTGFLNEFAKLNHRIRAKVHQHADTFRQLSAQELRNLKGLHLEPHKNAADPRARTIRVGDNYRGIVLDAGNDDLFVLMSVGTHDETDRWMAKNVFKVNAATGALEVLNAGAVEAEISEVTASSTKAGLFDHRKDKDFVQLGIEADLVPALRALSHEDELSGLLGVLPESQAEALIALTGDDPVESIYAEIVGREHTSATVFDVDDVAAALQTPASRATFRIVEDQQDLAEILNQPLAHWKIFLHPSQRSIVDKDVYNGPARITGGAGTGKTVVAIHRAKVLADRLEDRTGKPILFTTFTRNLAQAIEQDLRSLGGTDLLDVVEVMNVDRISHRIVSDAEGSVPDVARDDRVNQLFARLVDEQGLDFTPQFLRNEWEQVVLAQDEIRGRADYFTANRSGRGVPLDRRSRAKVWKAIEEFTSLLAESGERTYLQLAEDAAGYVARRSVKPYRHVVVDEAQDLHETQWRLLRAIVAPERNDMFVVGDSHQRIYDRRSSLSKVGINIRGRSKKLRINYRTTHEILGWSLALLGEGDFDDLDTGTETQDFAGYHSYRHGPVPELMGHRSKKEQMDALAAKVAQWVADGVQEESVGVAARGKASFDGIRRALEASGRQVCELPTDLPKAVGVRMGTMHRMKGLEFERLAIVDVDSRTVPSPAALTNHNEDPEQAKTDMQRELCLLYVAATRARDELWVGWSGKPSRFLGAVGVEAGSDG